MYGEIAWVCVGSIVTVTFAAAAAGVALGEELPPPQPLNTSGSVSTKINNPCIDEQRRVGI
jgi:hypothetical protein